MKTTRAQSAADHEGDGAVGCGEEIPPQRNFLNFRVKTQNFVHFIAKNYLWSETRTGCAYSTYMGGG